MINNKKILTIVGARPQFIKAAALTHLIRKMCGIEEKLVHTGQHYDHNMSALFFEELNLPQPDYNLGIGSGSHGEQTGRMLEAIEKVLKCEKPDLVLVYGDTNSTLAGCLAAVKLHIPTAHVEAGLRSGNLNMPEEINRILADRISALLFTPTEGARQNLLKEGIDPAAIFNTGDVMYDSVLFYGTRAEKTSKILNTIGVAPKTYILATVHRAENTDDPARLRSVFEGLAKVSREISVITPLHPRTRGSLQKIGLLNELESELIIIPPLGYLDMIMLEKSSRLVVTDSGGVQKEAFFFKVPCVTLRDETEWTELVEAGWNHLVPPHDSSTVYTKITAMLDNSILRSPVAPYGEGDAAQKIISAIMAFFDKR